MPSLPLRILDALLSPAPDRARVEWLAGHVYAHRGLHGDGAPENTLAAFGAAIDRGLGIECDVRRSREGRAIVFHDEMLERLTGTSGLARDRTVGELTKLKLRNSAECIPSLRDVLEKVQGNVPLLLELKSDGERSVTTLCRAVRRDLEGYRGRVAIMSFDSRIPRWFARRAPDLVRGLVISEQNARTLSGAFHRHRRLWHSKAQFLAYDIRDLPSSFAGSQSRRGFPVLTWTVTSSALRERSYLYADAPIAEGNGLAHLPGDR